MTSPEMLLTHADAPAAPALPVMPPSGRVTAIVEQLGLAMGGVKAPAYAAFAWRWGRDYRAKVELDRYLRREVLLLARHRGWPLKMRGERYLHKLAWLAVWEEHNWWWIRISEAWPRLIEVDEEMWKHRIAEKYVAVRGVLDVWCDDARRVAARRMIDIAAIDQRLTLAPRQK